MSYVVGFCIGIALVTLSVYIGAAIIWHILREVWDALH